MANYDSTAVGVPYVRVTGIEINYPVIGLPSVLIGQVKAVKMADGTVMELGDAPELRADIDLAVHGNDPIPLVSPNSGAPLGPSTTLNQVFLCLVAAVRDIQIRLVP